MYYVMSLERDDWGKLGEFRRGSMYKNYESARKFALKFPSATVYKYGKKVPVFSTNPKIKELLN